MTTLLNLNLDVAARMQYPNRTYRTSLRDPIEQGMFGNVGSGSVAGSSGGGVQTSSGNGLPSRNDSENPCPCTDCEEQIVEDTYYLTKEQIAGAKTYQTYTEKVVCDSRDDSVVLPCEEEIARIKSGNAGMNGLGRTQTDAEMDCNVKCRKALKENGVDFADAAKECAKKCKESGGLIKRNGDFGISYQQHQQQKLRLAMSGLSGDDSGTDMNTGGVYVTDDASVLPPPCGCGKATFNMWAWIASLLGVAFLTWIITYMATRRRA